MQIANANTEFVAFVEQDAGGTARRLAENLSPQACELFKLGALWGYSEMVRPLLPGERADVSRWPVTTASRALRRNV